MWKAQQWVIRSQPYVEHLESLTRLATRPGSTVVTLRKASLMWEESSVAGVERLDWFKRLEEGAEDLPGTWLKADSGQGCSKDAVCGQGVRVGGSPWA